MKAIKAVYNFIVGDMVILVGIVLVFLVLLLINNVAALTPIRAYSGAILVVVTLPSAWYIAEPRTGWKREGVTTRTTRVNEWYPYTIANERGDACPTLLHALC